MISLLLAAGVLGGGDPRIMDLVKELHKEVHDVAFNYEGQLTGPPYAGYLPEYSARFAYHGDSVVYFDRVVHKGSLVERAQLSWRPNEVALLIQRKASDEQPVQIVDVRPWNAIWDPQCAAGLFAPAVFGMMTRLETPYLVHVGRDRVEGVDCEVLQVEFAPGKTQSPTRHLVWKFWVDLQRGASLIRYEHHNSGRVHQRIHSISIEMFKGKDGRSVWVPVSAVFDDFVDYAAKGKDWTIASKPLSSWTFGALRETVKVNQGSSVGDVQVKFDRSKRIMNLAGTLLSNQGPPAEKATRFAAEKSQLESVMAHADDQVRNLGGKTAAAEDYGAGARVWPVFAFGALLTAVGLMIWRYRSA